MPPDLLAPEQLARLSNLHLRAQQIVEGVLSGLHRSPHHGQSVEFSEHKEYAAGDDVRHIDWKAYGKFDKYYLKRFEHETNLRAHLVVDASASMGYGARESKLGHAATAAAALAVLLIRQQDAVGLCIAKGEELEFVPPRSSPGHLGTVMEVLSRASPGGATHLGSMARRLSEKTQRRALILVFSDFFDPDPQGLLELLQLRAMRHEVALFQVLDPAELTFPFEDPTLFLSMEDDRRLETQPLLLRDGYLEEMNRFLASTRALCRERDCDYELLRTDEPLEAGLLRFLSRREKRGATTFAATP
jgi:uncharacterized protein (DUF58 family)